ncbi:GNAT family N-acetyltransferase [bacterium]|nr:GNAT family N-acetyltransferase [bacterium]
MIETITVDLNSNDHGRDVLRLLDAYAKDIMGGGQSLPEYTKANLIGELSQREDCVVILTHVDHEAAALAICFEGFSTFACRPILNIHDVMVESKFRGQGLSVELLKKAESEAMERGCCKMTLEVLSGNHRAAKIYRKFGFSPYELNDEMGQAMFYEKKL